MKQWCSQNRVIARAQVGQHIRCCAICGELACESMLFLGGSGACPPVKFRTSEIAFSDQVVIHISSIQEALSLLFSSQESSPLSPLRMQVASMPLGNKSACSTHSVKLLLIQKAVVVVVIVDLMHIKRTEEGAYA